MSTQRKLHIDRDGASWAWSLGVEAGRSPVPVPAAKASCFDADSPHHRWFCAGFRGEPFLWVAS